MPGARQGLGSRWEVVVLDALIFLFLLLGLANRHRVFLLFHQVHCRLNTISWANVSAHLGT
jgi:hypothetical protein